MNKCTQPDDFADDRYIKGIIKDVLTNPRVSENISSPSVEEFIFDLLDWLEKSPRETVTLEVRLDYYAMF